MTMDQETLRKALSVPGRVQSFAVEAMRAVVLETLDLSLGRKEALPLALAANMELVIKRLKQRLKVRRHHLDQQHQVELAVQEVSLELGGASEKEIASLVTRAVRVAREAERSALDQRRDQRRIKELFDRYDSRAPQVRRFFRDANRLLDKQRATLEAGIRGVGPFEAAMEELTGVYGRYLDKAVKISLGSGE